MVYKIAITEVAEAQFKSLTAREQRILETAITSRLKHQPTTPTRAVKRLRPNPFAEFELRADELRALYNVEGDEVVILAVGRKVGNKLIVEGENLMPIKTIPLSHLEANLTGTLTECSESGEPVVVELPEGGLLAIHSLDPKEDDNLIDELLATNPRFKALLQKSKVSTRKSFPMDVNGRQE